MFMIWENIHLEAIIIHGINLIYVNKLNFNF